MATIRKLRGRWQAQVRRRGAKPRAKSFDTKAEAERWARDIEAQVDRFGAAPDTRVLETKTLGDLMRRYQLEVTPKKRGHVQESQRIDVLLRHDLAHRTLIGLAASDLASYRDERLATAAPSTALRELAIMSHVLEVAMKDWGIPLARNPAKAIRRPQVNDARTRRLRLGRLSGSRLESILGSICLDRPGILRMANFQVANEVTSLLGMRSIYRVRACVLLRGRSSTRVD